MTATLTNRLEQAISKLYTAFQDNTLNPECCKQCAVGNILDNTDSWKHLSDRHGSIHLNYVGLVHERLGRTFNGYSPSELLQIEIAFLKACDFEVPFTKISNRQEPTKDILFNALSATISFMCTLDAVDDVMAYSKHLDYYRTQSTLMSVDQN